LGDGRLWAMGVGMKGASRDVGRPDPGKGALPGNQTGVLCFSGPLI